MKMRIIASVLLLTLLTSCGLVADASSAGKEVVTHSKKEVQELVDHSLDRFDKLADEKLQKLDESIEKAAKHIGTAVGTAAKEVLDTDVIAFAAVSVAGLGGLAVFGWIIVSWRRTRVSKRAKKQEQDNPA